jgi:hypothetical protein
MMLVVVTLCCLFALFSMTASFSLSRTHHTSRVLSTTSLNLFGNPEPPKNNNPANVKKDGGMFGGIKM